MKREVKHNGRSKTRKRPHGTASQRSEAPGGKSRQDFCPDHEICAEKLYASLHHCCGFNFCQRAGKRTGNHVHEDPDRSVHHAPSES